ncbi:MAG: branched-chain amino acid transaminase [Acidobacteriia bacterium]|nr:branched-chain amino acid transaminase [Terriglobia bacterium]
MSFTPSKLIWMNGKLVRWEEARIHVLSHVVHYGSSVFEGIRCYDTKRGPAVFRLREHVRRLFDSARVYRMPIPFTPEQTSAACLETVKANEFRACYIRPVAFRGYGDVGVNPHGCPVDLVIATWSWGAYLGPEALERGVDVQVSSWTRLAPNTLPALAKAGANYANSQLIKMEAIANGYVEGIALDTEGFVSEGSGENLFLVRDGRLVTPPLGASILPGITRASLIVLAREQGFDVVEERIPREALYLADELFFTGTAAEITPVRTVDRIEVGPGRPGPVTRRLDAAFRSILAGDAEDRHGWLEPVP